MASLTSKLMQGYYEGKTHPYRVFQVEVERIIHAGAKVVLDAGCGRSAPVLKKLLPRPSLPIGMDMVDFDGSGDKAFHLIKADLSRIPLREETVDCIFSRSVFEHLAEPLKVYTEMYRTMKRGGGSSSLRPTCGIMGPSSPGSFPVPCMAAS